MANLKHITAGIIAICFALAFNGIVNHVTGSTTTDINNDIPVSDNVYNTDEISVPDIATQTPNIPQVMPPHFEIINALINELEDHYLSANDKVSFRYTANGFEMWFHNTPGVVVVTAFTNGNYELSCPNTARGPSVYNADTSTYHVEVWMQRRALLCLLTAHNEHTILKRIQARLVPEDATTIVRTEL